MLTGGRVVGHLRHIIDDPAATILFVGYQGEAASPSSVLLRHNNLYLDIRIERSHPIGAEDPGYRLTDDAATLVIRPGYRLGGRLLRPAEVFVRGPLSPATGGPDPESASPSEGVRRPEPVPYGRPDDVPQGGG